jgi:hypothetical protein
MTESSIRFTFGESSLGQVLVAAADKGISAILFGKDRSSLRDELMDCLPDARPASKPSDLAEVVEKVIGLIEAPRTSLDLALDIEGSEFERRVWALLLEIPAGRDDKLRSHRQETRRGGHRSGGGGGLCSQSARRRNPLPPCAQGGRIDLRLSLGCCSQTGTSGP